MSGKGGGLFDDLFNNPFGGLFDFNGDGKEDLGEQLLGLQAFTNLSKSKGASDSVDLLDDFADHLWRDCCEDGSEYGIAPEDYETEEEYSEALNEAKYGWREYCDDGTEYDVDPEDYETEEEYSETLNEAKYGWREYCDDGTEYGVDPEDYETEEEYAEALDEAKYGWRRRYEGCDNAGLDPADFETYDEFRKAHGEKLRERQLDPQRSRERGGSLADAADKAYTFCGVMLPFSNRPYSYLADGEDVRIGDTVAVPVGDEGKEMQGEVVSVGMYTRAGAPFPVERAKHIIRVVARGE